MKYIKPEIEIEKFSILEDIMAEGTSAPAFNPWDESNDDPLWETLGQAFGDVFDITVK